MKYEVAELEGALLDAAVAKAEGLEATGEPWWPRYSMDWNHGGPIIEREEIDLLFADDDSFRPAQTCRATVWPEDALSVEQFGPTPLIAAMRAYVASKFGEEVEL